MRSSPVRRVDSLNPSTSSSSSSIDRCADRRIVRAPCHPQWLVRRVGSQADASSHGVEFVIVCVYSLWRGVAWRGVPWRAVACVDVSTDIPQHSLSRLIVKTCVAASFLISALLLHYTAVRDISVHRCVMIGNSDAFKNCE